MLKKVLMRIDKLGPLPMHRPELGPCWLWTGSTNTKGYGRIRIGKKVVAVHRYVYEQLVGQIVKPQLDHVCRVRACCNPNHLEPVTNAENQKRGENANRNKTECRNGHALTSENTIIASRIRAGKLLTERACRTCANQASTKYRAKKVEVDNG